MSKSSKKTPHVFISYSLDSEEHRKRVLDFAQTLRQKGVNAEIDQYYEDTILEDTWPVWMWKQIKSADFVIVVCTQMYYCRCISEESSLQSQGVRWESIIILQDLYDHKKNKRFITVGFTSRETNLPHIPEPLRGISYYDVSTKLGFTNLYRLLTKQPRVVPMKVGDIESLPPEVHELSPTANTYLPWSSSDKHISYASTMLYHDLWIEIEKDSSSYRPRLISSLLEQGKSNETTGEREDQQLTDILQGLSKQMNAYGTSSPISDFGKQLYEVLFTDKWAAYLQQLYTLCNREGAGLRIHITPCDELTAALPWELLSNPLAQQSLGSPPRYVVLRSPPGRCAEERSLSPPETPVRLLIVAPNEQEEIPIIQRCLEERIQQGVVVVDQVQPRSWDEFQRQVHDNSPQMLHLIVPGSEHGLMIGQKSAQRIHWAALQDFLDSLPDLRVVVLNMIDTQPSTPSPIRANPPCLSASDKLWTVASTRVPVNETTARWYTHLLYIALAAGHSMAFAVGLGRFGVAHCNVPAISQEWSSFMTDQICDVVPFPPLTVPPRWAARTRPQPEQVAALLHQANEAQRKLTPIRIALESPHPMVMGNLEGDPQLFAIVIQELTKLECRQELTSHKNQALTEARTAQAGLRQCLKAVEDLSMPNLDSESFSAQLVVARRMSKQAYDFSEKLIVSIKQLLVSLWSEERFA